MNGNVWMNCPGTHKHTRDRHSCSICRLLHTGNLHEAAGGLGASTSCGKKCHAQILKNYRLHAGTTKRGQDTHTRKKNTPKMHYLFAIQHVETINITYTTDDISTLAHRGESIRSASRVVRRPLRSANGCRALYATREVANACLHAASEPQDARGNNNAAMAKRQIWSPGD